MTYAVTEHTEPCIWMSAGLLSYRLCDLNYDCEHCPLDAALRGESPALAEIDPRQVGWTDHFPDDRSYTEEHLWIQGLADEMPATVRVGLDAFAVAMIGAPKAIDLPVDGEGIRPGARLTEIDLGAGALSIGSPLTGRVFCRNDAVQADTGLITSDPYGDGWLLQLVASEEPQTELLTGSGVREVSRTDLRWFRRRVACHLFADATLAGPCLPDGGQILTDLRQILGADRYVRLLKELFT